MYAIYESCTNITENTTLIPVKCMCIKFSDKQLKVAIWECLFCKNFLRCMLPNPLKACALHCASMQYTTSLPYDHISKMANQIWFLIGHSVLAIIFPYIILYVEEILYIHMDHLECTKDG